MKKILFILIAFLFIQNMQAQKETNIWHFGYNSGLDFNNPVNSVIGNDCWWNGTSWSYTYNIAIPNVPKVISGYVYTNEGCFSISDSSGNLLLSSDGITLYDKNGTALNSNSLGGHPSATQSGIVIPKPENSNSFYIASVSHERQGRLQYAEVNMSLNGGLGGIISQNNYLTTFNVDENIAAIPHSNGTDYWLINRTQNTYHVWAITALGITFSYSIPTGSSALSYYDFIGELIISPDGTRITALTFDRNEVLTADFDPSTGQIANTQSRLLGSNPYYGFYGGCFSPNGEYLYFSLTQLTAYVYSAYCISWTDLRGTGTPNYIPPVSNIHRGPDGRLYGIRVDSRQLFIVKNPNVGDLHMQYIDNYFSATQYPRAGLPTFLSSYLKTDLSIYPLACNRNPREISVEITSGGASPATTIDWDFGDGTVITGQPITINTTKTYSQVHTYATSGIKTITITPKAADGTPKPAQTFQIEVIPCAIKTNRVIRSNLKNLGEP